MESSVSNSLIYKHKKVYDYALAILAFLMPIVVKGFPVLIVFAAVTGILYFFFAYRKLGKPKKEYYILPYNLVKDGVVNIVRRKGVMFYMLILFTLYCFSLFYTENGDVGIDKIILKSCYLYFPLIFALTKWDKVKLLRVMDFYILGCLFQVLLSFVDAYMDGGNTFILNEFSYAKLSFNMHPSYASMVTVLGLIFSIVRFIFLIRDKAFKKGVKYIVVSLLFVLYAVLLSSKAGIISLVLAIIFLIIYVLYVFRSWKMFLAMFIGVGLFLGVVINLVGHRMMLKFGELASVAKVEKTKEAPRDKSAIIGSSEIRLVLWGNSFQAVKNSWFFGYGVGDAKDILQAKLKDSGEIYVLNKNYNSHNQFLQTALSIGVFGVLLLVLILGSSLRDFGNFSLIAVLFVLIILINFLTESMMEKQAGSIVIVWLLCFLNSGRAIFKSVFSLSKA